MFSFFRRKKVNAAPPPLVRPTSERITPINECRRWVAEYKRRANVPGANFDDSKDYIKCIQAVGGLATAEAMAVLEDVKANAMFTDVHEAATAALNQIKFGIESATETCTRLLAQQEAWATTFVGKAVEEL
jgi:hypothetical protein